MNLESATAIVTGAGSGLGAAITATLVKEGATVYGIARTVAANAAVRLLKKLFKR